MTAPSQPAAEADGVVSSVTQLLAEKLAILSPCPDLFLRGLMQQAERGEMPDGDLVYIACSVLLGRAA